MKITFLGGTETVTGSKFLLETDQTRVLVDCGLFQGYKWLRERNWQTLPMDIDTLDAVLLTHAHLDHSGYLPVLYKHGFRGPVYTHHATKDLCQILLADSGHIHEEDAKYYSKHKLGKHEHPEPLYDRQTAEDCMVLFQSVDFDTSIEIGEICFYLQPAGHILGAASVIVEAEGKRIGFSGDVGRFHDVLMKPPRPLPALDLLLMESTYGNRLHDTQDPFEQLAEVVNQMAMHGGVLLIPAFAVGRAQALQHMLATLMETGRIPRIPIYLDSPMAIQVSDIFCQYRDQHRLNADQCQRMCNDITYIRTVDESKAIEKQAFPHIIIAGSGMATGGRILHHFKRLLGSPKTTVLFTGYQVGGTRGDKMLNGVETVKIHGEWIPLRASVKMLSSLSGHADYLELTQWLQQSALADKTRIQLIHGDPEALEGLRVHLQEQTKFSVNVAGYWSILRL
ncbi:MBL fold metallo-hydrolase [Photobacterium galatheae]|uniref:mRNA 3'-end processing factor n=1 Tax=Photobacterium galatheae TaxID=1654360 RepID=A0A066RZU3_9GAMM|nr:MBL fold metallo-hydrolase [Photobacterium galatheae]KDM93167.1 mRNA 3'-end processing factor [Photobacterium galatheae]MCM0148304.1 MBL fold metallo-hydrolase [Photobacterium galatheae]